MNYLRMGLLGALLTCFVGQVGWAANYKEGEVIVKYKDGATRVNTLMASTYDSVGVKKVRYYRGSFKNFEHLILKSNTSVEAALRKLRSNPTVEYAQPNYILTIPERNWATLEGELPPCIPGMIEPPNCDPSRAIPCIPGMELPGCDPNACIFPGIPFPPGCEDGGGGGGGGGGDGKPELGPEPPEVSPPQADPDLAQAWGIGKVQADQAWGTNPGNKQIIVADIDTGIDYTHPDLTFNLWRNPNPSSKNDIVGYDFIHDDGLPFDDQGHGTHTAGTIGAVGANGVGVSGVSQRVSIMGLKFLDAQGSGTTADAIKAIDYGIQHGARIMSNSWGGGADPDNQALYDAIERAKGANVLFVVAAGNDGVNNDTDSNRSYPASFDNDNLVAVAATDPSDNLAYFSNYGKKTTHLGAPGVNVYSTVPGDSYTKHSGTSMACPHVAGAAAMIWAQHPDWGYKQVKNALLNSTDPVSALQNKTATGGRLNVMRALQVMD